MIIPGNPVTIIAHAISTDWDNADTSQRRWWLLKSRNATAALEKAGFVIVPAPATSNTREGLENLDMDE
jgi:hypothetical protein